MNWSAVRTLYWRELRSALRERSIVVNSIIIPIVLYPLIIWLAHSGFTFVAGQNEKAPSRIVLQDLPVSHQDLKQHFLSDENILLAESPDPDGDLRAGNIDIVAVFSAVPGEPENFAARLIYDGSRDRSTTARGRVETVIERYREDFLTRDAARRGISESELEAFSIEDTNVSTDAEMGQFILGILLPMMLIIMLSVGAMYPAVDTTAGERETGTWETLMTVATSRANILTAKFLYVATMAFVAGMLNVLAMLFSLRSILGPIAGAGEQGPSFQVPLASIPIIAAGAALMALFIAAGMMILASFARTFKEGQSFIGPFYIVLILPITFIQTSAAEFTLRAAFIPVINVAIMFRQAIVGVYDWPFIAVTLAVEAACIGLALMIAGKIVSQEDFVTGSYHGTFAKFAAERFMRKRRREPSAEGSSRI